MSQNSQTSKTYACSVCGAIFKTHTELGVHALKYKHFKAKPERKAPNGVEILPVRASDYYVTSVPNAYVPQAQELRLIEAHMSNGVPLLFVGPKGTGKTLAFAYFAYITHTPIIQFDCSEGTKRLDLIGRFILQGDQVKYVLGALPTAISIANEVGKAILVLEEINALTPQMQKVLNQILDWRKHVYVPELGLTYRLKPDAKLLIGATMNPSTYGGVFELNEDLRSRFVEYFMGYPSENKESEILTKLVNDVSPDLKKMVLTLAIETRQGVNRGELSYALSTRDLVNFFKVYASYRSVLHDDDALKEALTVVVVNRYDDAEQRNTIKQRIMSIFPNVRW